MIATTWYRDSHGLFDFEEDQKIQSTTYNQFGSFFFKREGEILKSERFTDYAKMRMKCSDAKGNHKIEDSVATFLCKDN